MYFYRKEMTNDKQTKKVFTRAKSTAFKASSYRKRAGFGHLRPLRAQSQSGIKSMKESDVEIILQRAREKFPDARPQIISDNGPQFIARDFKEFIRISGMTHVKTSPYYPQSNGKLERYHRTIKGSCIRVNTPLSMEDAIRLVTDFVDHYNYRRLHSAIGYVTPIDKLEGRPEQIRPWRRASKGYMP
jgi:transposase InsO family protein